MRLDTHQLFETYRQNIFAAAFNVCKNADDAEDVTQETFLRYHRANKQFQSEQHIKAWLLRVAINGAKDVWRAGRRRNEVPLEDYMETLPFESPESSALFEAVMALPANYRSVIHLFYDEDYTVQEIADSLHLTQSNVKVRLTRGRAKHKKTLKGDWNDDES